MRNKLLLMGLLVVIGGFASSVSAQTQTQCTMPAHGSVYSGNVRGYYFQAANDFTITGVLVPTDANAGVQTVEIVRFDSGPPTLWPTTTNAFQTLIRIDGNASTTTPVLTHAVVKAGDYIGVYGNRADQNSYAGAPTTQTIAGQTVDLYRSGMQQPISSNPMANVFAETGGSISRTFIYTDLDDDPELNIYKSTTSIGTGVPHDLGGAETGVANTYAFTVDNPSSSNALTITSIAGASSGVGNVTGTASPVLASPSPLAAASSTAFILDLTPTAAGAFEFTVTIMSDDPDEGTFTMILQGTGVAGPNEMDVQRPAATSIADGGADAYATPIPVGGPTTITYTVENTGLSNLTLYGTAGIVLLSNTSNCSAVSVDPISSSVAGSGTVTFDVAVTPASVGVWSLDITIVNDDANENPYNFTVSGTAVANVAPVIAVTESGNAVVADQVLNVAASSTVTALTLVLGATDADVADTITLTSVVTSTGSITGFAQAEWDDAGNNPATTSPATGTFSATGVMHTVVITAVDNNAASSTLRFFILVAGGSGAAPTAALTGTSSMTGNSTAGFTLSVETNTALALADLQLADGDSDPVDILSVTGSAAPGVTAPTAATGLAVPATISWTGTPTAAGTYVYTVTYTDNNTAPQSFTVTITVTDPSTGVGGGSGGGGGSGCAAGTSGSNVWFAVLGLLGLVAVIRLRREVA